VGDCPHRLALDHQLLDERAASATSAKHHMKLALHI
jgi:hypothetical protein